MANTFYRVCNVDTQCGLWYNQDGSFSGLIHEQFNFCKNNSLQMPFDNGVVGYLSATPTLEELYDWFSKEDIKKLQEHGWFIYQYEADDFKFHNNHYLINQHTSKPIARIELWDARSISIINGERSNNFRL